ncbi:MAG: P-II family nitrogen regulator [Ruminococcus sp.]|jgi:nitrogen regulatory protein PII
MNKIYMMAVITDRSKNDKLFSLFREHHLKVTLTLLGSGTAGGTVLDYLGLEDTEKCIHLTFVTGDAWKKMKKHLLTIANIQGPGKGIAFLIPLSSIGGKKALEYVTSSQPLSIEEESTLKNTEHELLIAIANAGYTDLIMEAARGEGAPGGTILHAKGTGAEYARKFLGISLSEEKELVLIVVKSAQKNRIMKAIMERAGMNSKAGTVIFSLPVTSTAGLRFPDDEEIEEDL